MQVSVGSAFPFTLTKILQEKFQQINDLRANLTAFGVKCSRASPPCCLSYHLSHFCQNNWVCRGVHHKLQHSNNDDDDGRMTKCCQLN